MEKRPEMRLKLARGDLFAAGAVLLLAAVCALLLFGFAKPAGQGTVAAIYRDGELVREIDLSALEEPVTFTIDGDYHNVVVAENGRIRVESSDCPGETCVHTGWISEPGRTIVCLPNRLEIRIVGESEVDIVVG